MMAGTPILSTKVVRALMACFFLMLAAWQPGMAAAANGAASIVTTGAGHNHDAASVQDHAAPDTGGMVHEETAGTDHHQPASMDLCCEMHCLMSQAMPSASPLIDAPGSSGHRADFTHALPDGQVWTEIKPPRTIS